jgi:hypothetical protein
MKLKRSAFPATQPPALLSWSEIRESLMHWGAQTLDQLVPRCRRQRQGTQIGARRRSFIGFVCMKSRPVPCHIARPALEREAKESFPVLCNALVVRIPPTERVYT